MAMCSRRNEKGAALAGVMMALLILTLLGSTAFLNTTTELKISSNYTQSLQALYAAEAGLEELLSVYRQRPMFFLEKKNGRELNFPVGEPTNPSGPGPIFWIKEMRYDPNPIPTYVEVIIHGKDLSPNSLARLRATICCTLSGIASDVPPIFQIGIATAGRLHFSGPLEISGNLHANQGFSLDPSSINNRTSTNSWNVTQSLDPLGSNYLPPQDVPVITEEGFEMYRILARQTGNQSFLGHQDLCLTGDQKGRLIFVDGNVNLTGNSVSGLTLVATGSITLSGSIHLVKNLSLDTAFIAGRDIIIKDSNQPAGVFWSNGAIQKSGSGKLIGAVVCQESVFQLDGFQFKRIAEISNPYLSQSPQAVSFRLGGWAQI